MNRTTLLLLLGLSLAVLAPLSACSSDDKGPVVNLTDSGPPDADTTDAPPPDAFVCTLTECGDQCIDTTTDSLNCGGCGLACATPGQICSGSLPCACPADFVTSPFGGGIGDMVFMQAGANAALAVLGFSPLNVAVVVFDLTLSTETDYDLADSLANTTPPSIALGYDVDFNSQEAKTAYAATAGSITFDTLCDDGASGTVTDVVFVEVAGIYDPTPLINGCSLMYDTLSFDIGSCP